MDIRNNNNRDKRVKNLGFWSWTPLVLFTAWHIYYMVLAWEHLHGFSIFNHFAIISDTMANYTSLFITLAIACTVAAGVLLYLVWDVWTKREIPAGQKTMWVLFLVTFGAFAFPIYWYMRVKNPVRRSNASPALS